MASIKGNKDVESSLHHALNGVYIRALRAAVRVP